LVTYPIDWLVVVGIFKVSALELEAIDFCTGAGAID
jgi:hypothetical protein